MDCSDYFSIRVGEFAGFYLLQFSSARTEADRHQRILFQRPRKPDERQSDRVFFDVLSALSKRPLADLAALGYD